VPIPLNSFDEVREEVDALLTMGLDPVEVLILPRGRCADHRAADPELHRLDRALYGGGLVAQFYGDMGRRSSSRGCMRRCR